VPLAYVVAGWKCNFNEGSTVNDGMSLRIATALCVALLLLGGAFVIDAINPSTPDPDVSLRNMAFAALFFLLLKTLATRDSVELVKIPATRPPFKNIQIRCAEFEGIGDEE
jgi:hypothetical protein